MKARLVVPPQASFVFLNRDFMAMIVNCFIIITQLCLQSSPTVSNSNGALVQYIQIVRYKQSTNSSCESIKILLVLTKYQPQHDLHLISNYHCLCITISLYTTSMEFDLPAFLMVFSWGVMGM